MPLQLKYMPRCHDNCIPHWSLHQGEAGIPVKAVPMTYLDSELDNDLPEMRSASCEDIQER